MASHLHAKKRKKLRNLARNFYLTFFGSFKKPSNSVHILNGHYVSKLESSNDGEIFENLINKLSNEFRFLKFEDACELITKKKIVSEPMIAFSFDDGFATCYKHIAPALEKHKINGAFFINPGVIESDLSYKRDFLFNQLKSESERDFMSWAEIQKLHLRGHIIGNHGMHHKTLKGLSSQEASIEISSGKLLLESKLGYSCKYFALTYGNPNYFDNIGLQEALNCHDFVFTSYEYQKYFHLNNPRILSRRHFEGSWPFYHVMYFSAKGRVYDVNCKC